MTSGTGTIIGIDTHISTCNLFALARESEKILGADYFSTNTTNLISYISKYPKPRFVVIEQGPLSGWIERSLENHVEKIIVSDTKRNFWISRDPNKSDTIDSEKLARLYKGGYINEIKTRSKEKSELISLVLQYNSLMKQQTRVKLQIGAKFREAGKRKRGRSAYRDENITTDLICFSHNNAMKKSVLQFKEQLNLFEKQVRKTKCEMQKIQSNFPEIRFLRSFPGIGFVGSITLSALIDIPERFATLKKIWIYCGYGLDRQSSGGKMGPPRITKRSNRLIKDVIMTAAHNIISRNADNIYNKLYLKEVENGKNQRKAKVKLARKLIKDIWLGWRDFNEKLNNKE